MYPTIHRKWSYRAGLGICPGTGEGTLFTPGEDGTPVEGVGTELVAGAGAGAGDGTVFTAGRLGVTDDPGLIVEGVGTLPGAGVGRLGAVGTWPGAPGRSGRAGFGTVLLPGLIGLGVGIPGEGVALTPGPAGFTGAPGAREGDGTPVPFDKPEAPAGAAPPPAVWA